MIHPSWSCCGSNSRRRVWSAFRFQRPNTSILKKDYAASRKSQRLITPRSISPVAMFQSESRARSFRQLCFQCWGSSQSRVAPSHKKNKGKDTMLLSGRNYIVIGIMPAKFEFPIPLFNLQGGQFAERVDIWKPVAFSQDELKSRGSRSYGVIARLRPNVTSATGQAEIDTTVANWVKAFPNYSARNRFGAKIYPLHEQVVAGMRKGLFILIGAVTFVLLIACANLATMLLARASACERELAIRMALGAGTWRLLRQRLTESIALALAGGAAGVLLSVWGLELLKRVG